MARHQIKAAAPKPRKPRAEIRAAPTLFERAHPVGSAERFLDDAAKEALASAAAGGLPTPKQLMPAAVKAMVRETGRYPDPLLERIAKLPDKELLARAARAEAYQRAMEAQNAAVDALSATMSPVADIARTQAAAAIAVHQDAKGGEAVSKSPETVSESPETVSGGPEAVSGGPRIVINPTTFTNKKDALCVAFNEGFRLWMEATGFEPQSEPTEKQRKFFSDTAYADDELQLRRTILARIATFDTSVKDPTDDQLSETASFLNAVLESDWCRNDWERNSVQKLARAVEASVGAEPVEPKAEPVEPRSEEPLTARAALGAGETEDDERNRPVDPESTNPEDFGLVRTDPAASATDTAASGLASMEPDGESPSTAAEGAQSAPEEPRPQDDIEQPQSGQQTLATFQIVEDETPAGGRGSSRSAQETPAPAGSTVAERRERHPLRMNGPSIEPTRRIGDIGARSLTDTKSMNGPSIGPIRPIGTMDPLDGSGGSTLRRKKMRRSRT